MALTFPPYQHAPGVGTFPTFTGLLSDAHNRRGLGSTVVHAAPVPKPTGPPAPSSPNPYAGLFSGSAFDQAQKIAAYLLNPYTQQYNTATQHQSTLDAQRVAQLQAYINQVAQGLQGVAPQVLGAYQGAAQDQVTWAKGFSDAVQGAVQDSANQDNQLLNQIGAPSGQDIPSSQAVGVSDVLYGTGGYIPATSLAAQGARAYAQAAGLPALIQQRGLGVIGDLLAKQQDAQTTADTAYQQIVAQQPQNILTLYGQIKDRQAANQTAARGDVKIVGDSKTGYYGINLTTGKRQLLVPPAESAKSGTWRIQVFPNGTAAWVSSTGQLKSLKGNFGKAQRPLVIGSSTAGWTIYDSTTGKKIGEKPPATAKPNLYPVLDKTTGDLTWYDKSTGLPVSQSLGAVTPPPPKEPAPHFYKLGAAEHAVWQDPESGKWHDQVIATGPVTQSIVSHYDPTTGMTTAVDQRTGKIVWRQQTGTAKAAAGSGALQHVVINGHTLTFDPASGTFHDPVTHAVIDPNLLPKPAKPLSSGAISKAWQVIRQGKTGWWALQTQPDHVLTADEFRSAVKDAGYKSVGDFLTAYNQLPPDQQTALEDKLGVQYTYGDPQEIYLHLVENGIPARRAWGMVRKQWPDWGANYFKNPKAVAAAKTAAYTGYPLGTVGKVIGLPNQGSHTLYGNWESDNAIDISVPIGTPVYAVADGTIGPQIGPLSSNDPHLEGLRLHLVGGGNEWYYAHLSKLVVQAGDKVKKGDLLGYSGSANGTAHLHIAQEYGSPLDLTKRGKVASRAATAGSVPYDPAAAVTPSGARTVGRSIAQSRYGWTGDEWNALDALITSESGWNYTAVNPSSGAAGIGQALGHKLPPGYAKNPVVQIRWMLRYVKQRYGTPSKAWAFKQTHGWY